MQSTFSRHKTPHHPGPLLPSPSPQPGEEGVLAAEGAEDPAVSPIRFRGGAWRRESWFVQDECLEKAKDASKKSAASLMTPGWGDSARPRSQPDTTTDIDEEQGTGVAYLC